jgi:catalase
MDGATIGFRYPERKSQLMAEDKPEKIEQCPVVTTNAGRPVGDNQNSLTVGPRGPLLSEDYVLFEKMAAFNR